MFPIPSAVDGSWGPFASPHQLPVAVALVKLAAPCVIAVPLPEKAEPVTAAVPPERTATPTSLWRNTLLVTVSCPPLSTSMPAALVAVRLVL
ncbi:MAG: hypothetical protein ACOCYE_06895, partial [Pseudomonadota bacterium]